MTRELTAEEKQAIQIRFLQCKAEVDAVCKKYGFAIRVGQPTVDLVPVQNPIG